MTQLTVGDIWYGKEATAYTGVTARIDAITSRNVQIDFDRTVSIDGFLLGGTVMTHKQFRLHFDPGQQISLFG
jgi:hypothetical protein